MLARCGAGAHMCVRVCVHVIATVWNDGGCSYACDILGGTSVLVCVCVCAYVCVFECGCVVMSATDLCAWCCEKRMRASVHAWIEDVLCCTACRLRDPSRDCVCVRVLGPLCEIV